MKKNVAYLQIDFDANVDYDTIQSISHKIIGALLEASDTINVPIIDAKLIGVKSIKQTNNQLLN